MPAALRPFTVEELEAIPYDGNRYELLHGVLLVTPQAGFPHPIVATRLAAMLGSFLQDEPGVQACAPGAVEIRPSIHLEPDVLIGGWPAIPRWDAVQDHWLAVEVSGTGSRVYDRDYKRDGYLGIGVKEVWLVDLDVQRIFVSRPGFEKDVPHETTLTWRSPGGRDLFIDVAAIFRGGTALEAAADVTAGAKKDFAGGSGRALDGLGALSYLGQEDVTDRGIRRHGGQVTRIRLYRVTATAGPRYLLVHLTTAGSVTDYDVVER